MKPEFNPTHIRLIIGLGNPGKDFVNTYHNVGFIFIEESLKKNEEKTTFTSIPRKKIARQIINGITLIKPETFMNESGTAVKNALQYEKIPPLKLLVVHDDNDIPLGSFKIDFNRGAAGHNGIASIIKSLGTKEFWRLRIGIQKITPAGRKKAGDFVLSKISAADKKNILRACHEAWEIFNAKEV